MPIQTMNPARLLTPQGYAHLAIATCSRTVYLEIEVTAALD